MELSRKTKAKRKEPLKCNASPFSTVVVDNSKHTKSLTTLQGKKPRMIKPPVPTDRVTRSATKLANTAAANLAKAKAALQIQDLPTEVLRTVFEELVGGYIIDIKFDEVAPGKFELDRSVIPKFDVQIARVCKTWAAEIISILYGKNVFAIHDIELFDRKFLSSLTPVNKAWIRKIALKEDPCNVPIQMEVDQLLRINPELYHLQSIDVTLVHCCRFLSQFETQVMAKQAVKERILWTLYRLRHRFPMMTVMVEKTKGFDGHICLGIRRKGFKISGKEIRYLRTEEQFYEDLKARVPELFFPFRIATL